MHIDLVKFSVVTGLTLLMGGCLPDKEISQDPLCLAVLKALPRNYDGGRSCVAVPAGVVVGDRKEIEGLAPILTEGRAEYIRYFEADPRRVVFLVGTEIPEAVEREVTRRDALPFNWPSMKGQKDTFVKAMRAEVNTTFASAPRATRERALKKLVDGFDDNIGDYGNPSPFEIGTIRHELGHNWFTPYYDGGLAGPATDSVTGRYGSLAPDWLDEASAIMMENSYLTNMRRKQLVSLLEDADQPPPTMAFLTGLTHPTQSNREEAGTASQGNISVRVQIGRKNADPERDSAWFYTMIRGFIDYLVERSGDPRIISSIAGEMMGGGSLASWLASSPTREAFGGSISSMEHGWQTWLAERQARGLEPAQ